MNPHNFGHRQFPTTTVPFSTYNPPRHSGLDLIYCDESFLVVNKPAGLLSVPGRGTDKTDSMATRIQAEFPDARSVHRLDMGTSGLLIFARGKDMHRQLSRLFHEHRVKKSYIAMLDGHIDAAAGEVDIPLIPDWPNRPRQRIDFFLGKSSLTYFRLLTHGEYPVHTTITLNEQRLDISRVELTPVTGRTHQLRVHMAAIGHPILGDLLYGGEVGSATPRMLLHARTLSFVHPLHQMPLTLTCEPSF